MRRWCYQRCYFWETWDLKQVVMRGDVWKRGERKGRELELFCTAGAHDLSLPRKLVLDQAVIVQEQWLALPGAEG